MTIPKQKPICDFCSKEIDFETTQYTIKVSPKSFVRGVWYKETRADMCHKCHVELCSRGYFKPKYQKMIQDPTWDESMPKSKKWIPDISDPQKVLSTNPELTA